MVTEGQPLSDDNASFLRAARGGNLEKVLEYLKANTDINTCNANGLNALHLAAKEGHVAVVKELLSRGAKIDAATKKGNTALHIASLAGQDEVVRLLVDNGGSVNVQSQNGFTPLYMAAQENHDGVVRFLLASGANQSLATEDGFTPLAVALQQGHDKVVAVLLENDTRGKVRLPALHIAAKKDDTKAAGLLLQSGDHNPDVTSKSGFTPLHIAAHYGNENIATLLLQRNANVNYAAKHNITPLHVAAKWGKANMVSLLLDKGANLESKTRDGLTPLHCAARSGHENVVDMMLQRGAPISAKTKNGLAPLHMASQGDHVDAARILLHHKAPVDEVTVDYLTALHVAAHCGHVRVAKLLLDRKADPNARALNGFTPLHIACKKNRIKVVELLLKYGASIEATTESGLTPLHVASFMGCMNIVIFLIQNQASPDEATVRGETPLHLAARANQTDIIRILLRNGAKVDARAREQQTPLHIASRLGNVDIVLLLLQSGAQVDANTKDLYTALHIAAKEGQEEVASVLMDHNASLVAMTKKGFTPLHLAAKYGNLKVSSLILEKNCTPAVVDAEGKNGVTPLHVAAHYDHQNVALLLLDKGASPHASAKNGYTPLHITAKKNQLDIATSLLEYGAKTDADSKAGFTPLHLASQEGHVDITNLLLKNGGDPNARAKNGLAPIHLCSQEDRVNVAAILAANGADLDAETKAGYTPLLVASHFGTVNMARFLLERDVKVETQNELGYTPLHQAAQQGHTQIVNMLLENNASPNTLSHNGQTALSVAQRLGYISVVETLKVVTENDGTANAANTNANNATMEEKYKVNAPESMQETFMSDSEDEGDYYERQSIHSNSDENMIGEHSYKYLTVDEMKSLGDDSMPIDVTHDEKQHKDSQGQITSISALAGPPGSIEEKLAALEKTRDYKNSINEKYLEPDNVDLPSRHPINIGFLVSFMVDARGGAMRGCRHSGVRVIIPPRKAPMPMRITCRYLKKDKLIHPPPMMEGEAIASRILELGPSGAKFLGPVIIEVPHFAALRGKEREIVILRSDNGETWKEHTLEATEDAVQEVLQESFDADELSQLEDLNTNRITRILTTDFPQYFAIVSRIRQEVHAIGPEGGVVNSTVVPQVQAVFPQGALTKKIKVGLQAHPIPAELTAKLLGNRVAVSPIVTVEPRRRKFHKPITLTIPVPQAAGKGMINQYTGETPTLRLLCSITGVFRKRSLKGGTTRAQWEDVTGSTPLTFVNDCVNFTTTVSARFWLMDCRNISEATKMATELYREAIHVPFMAKFVVFAKRHESLEARLRVFCMTDDKEDKTLEHQEHFSEVAKSRDVEVLEGKSHFIEFGGNLVPVTKSGDQLSLRFFAFRENRLPFSVKVKDPHSEALGRIAFMREAKSARQDAPQTPICNLNVALPETITPEMGPADVDAEAIESKYSFLREAGYGKFDTIHRVDLRISDTGNLLGSDWVKVAHELNIPDSDINIIKSEYPDNNGQQAMVMLRLWLNNEGNRATGTALERALRKCDREDIINKCIFNAETDTDDANAEHSIAKTPTTPDQAAFDSFKEELGPSRESTLPRQEAIKGDDDDTDVEGGKLADEERISEKMTLQQKFIHETVSGSKMISHEDEILLEKSKKSYLDEDDEMKYSAEEKTFYKREIESVEQRSEVIESKLTSMMTEELLQREENTFHESFENKFRDHVDEQEVRKETVRTETVYQESHVEETSVIAKAEHIFEEKRDDLMMDDVVMSPSVQEEAKDEIVVREEANEDIVVQEQPVFRLQQAEECDVDEDINEICDVEEKSYQDDVDEDEDDKDAGSPVSPHPKVVILESTDKESDTESGAMMKSEEDDDTDFEAGQDKEEPVVQVSTLQSEAVENLVEVEEEICQEVIIKKRRASDESDKVSLDETIQPQFEMVLESAKSLEEDSDRDEPSHPTEVEIRLHEAPERTADSDEETLELVKQQQQIERDHYTSHVRDVVPDFIEREAVHEVLDEDEVLEEAVVFHDDISPPASQPIRTVAATPPPSPLDATHLEKSGDAPSLEEVAAIAHYKLEPQRESSEDFEQRMTSDEEEAAERISPDAEDLDHSKTTIGFVAIESNIVDFEQIKIQSELDLMDKSSQEVSLSKGIFMTSNLLEKSKVTSTAQEDLRSPTDSQLSSSGLWSDTGMSLGDISVKPQSMDHLDQSMTTDLGDLSEMSLLKLESVQQEVDESESSTESARQVIFTSTQKSMSDSCTSPLKDQQATVASSPIVWPGSDVNDMGTDPVFQQPITCDAKLSPILFVESKGTSPMSSQGDTPCMVDATSSPPKSLMVSAQTSPPALDDVFFYHSVDKFRGYKDSPEGGEQLPFQLDMDSPDKILESKKLSGEIHQPHFVLEKLSVSKSQVINEKTLSQEQVDQYFEEHEIIAQEVSLQHQAKEQKEKAQDREVDEAENGAQEQEDKMQEHAKIDQEQNVCEEEDENDKLEQGQDIVAEENKHQEEEEDEPKEQEDYSKGHEQVVFRQEDNQDFEDQQEVMDKVEDQPQEQKEDDLDEKVDIDLYKKQEEHEDQEVADDYQELELDELEGKTQDDDKDEDESKSQYELRTQAFSADQTDLGKGLEEEIKIYEEKDEKEINIKSLTQHQSELNVKDNCEEASVDVEHKESVQFEESDLIEEKTSPIEKDESNMLEENVLIEDTQKQSEDLEHHRISTSEEVLEEANAMKSSPQLDEFISTTELDSSEDKIASVSKHIDFHHEIKFMACNIDKKLEVESGSEILSEENLSPVPEKSDQTTQEARDELDPETEQIEPEIIASKSVTFSHEVYFSEDQSQNDDECFYQVKISEIPSQIEKGESFDSAKQTDSKSEEIDELLLLVMPPGHARLNVEDQDDSEFDQVNAPRIIVTPTMDDDFSDYYQESLPEEGLVEHKSFEEMEKLKPQEDYLSVQSYIEPAIKCSLLHSQKFWSSKSDESLVDETCENGAIVSNLDEASLDVSQEVEKGADKLSEDEEELPNLCNLARELRFSGTKAPPEPTNQDEALVSLEETIFSEVNVPAENQKLQEEPPSGSLAQSTERSFILYQELERSQVQKRPSSVETVEEEYESGYEITTGREMKSFDDSTLMEQSLEIYQQSEKTDSLLQESTMHESLSMEKTISEPTIEPDLPSDTVEEFEHDMKVKIIQPSTVSPSDQTDDKPKEELQMDDRKMGKSIEDSEDTSVDDSTLLKRIVYESTEELFRKDSYHTSEDSKAYCQNIQEERDDVNDEERLEEVEEQQLENDQIEVKADSAFEQLNGEKHLNGKQFSMEKDVNEAEDSMRYNILGEPEGDIKEAEDLQTHSKSKTFTRQLETQTMVSTLPVSETVELLPIISWNLSGDQTEFVKASTAIQDEKLDTFECDESRVQAPEQCFSPGQESFIPSSRCSERSGTQSSIELHSTSSKSESSQSHSTRVISESSGGAGLSISSFSRSDTPGEIVSGSPFSSTRYSCGSQSASRTPSDLSQNNLDSKSGSFVEAESASGSEIIASKSSSCYQHSSSISTQHSTGSGADSSVATHSSSSKLVQISASEAEKSYEESRSQATTTESGSQKDSSSQNENENDLEAKDGSDDLSVSACSLPSSPRRLRRAHSSGVKKITSEIFSTESDITRSLEIVYTEPAENPRRKLSEKYRHASSNGASESSISNEGQKVEKRKPSVTMIKKRSNEEILLSESGSQSSSDLEEPVQTEVFIKRDITEKIQPSPTKLKERTCLPKTSSLSTEEIIAPVLQVVCQTPERSQKHLYKYAEDDTQTDEEKEQGQDNGGKSGFSKSLLQSETHPMRQQKSSSYEDDESSHHGSASPELVTGGKVRHESSSSSASSSKRSVESKGSNDDQARLLETADQELMDEMVVRDDVEDVAFGVAKDIIQEEQKMELETALSPLTSSREENSQPETSPFEITEKCFDMESFDPVEKKVEDFSVKKEDSSEPLKFCGDHKDLSVSASGDISKGSSESGDENAIRVQNYEAEETQMLLKDSSEDEDGEAFSGQFEIRKTSSSGKDHLESMVMPSEEECQPEGQALEFKAIPSDKQSSQIDPTEFVTMQIKGGILNMELNQSEDPVMSDSSISAVGHGLAEEGQEKAGEGRSLVQFCSPSFESSVETKSLSDSPPPSPTPPPPPPPSTKEVKKSSIKFAEEQKCPISMSHRREEEGAKQAAEDLVKAIKIKAVEIVQEINQRPNCSNAVPELPEPEPTREDNIEVVREVASDFVTSLTSRAVQLAEKMVPIIRAEVVEPNTPLATHFTQQTSFRSHFVVAFDATSEPEPEEHSTPLRRDIDNNGTDENQDYSDSDHKENEDEHDFLGHEDVRRHMWSGQDNHSSENFDEDIWADQDKVTYRSKMLISSTSSSFKKTASDTESGSKLGDRRSGTDFESSSDVYQTAHDNSSGLSRPGSSDVEILLSAISHKSSDLTTEYDTAPTSHRSNATTTSGEYHTAVSSLMSEESLKSHDESSGHLGSIEISEAASDTLKDAHIDLDRESLCTPSGPPHEEIFQGFPAPGSTLFDTSPVSDTEDDNSFVSHMVRSKEMIFHPEPQVTATSQQFGQADDLEEEEYNQSVVPQIDFTSLSESRETLSASILTISSTSEVTILHTKDTPETRKFEPSHQDPESLGNLSDQDLDEPRKGDDFIPSTVPSQGFSRPVPLPRVVSFERAVVFESMRIKEQKSIDSELESRPESELKELDSRPQSILSRSSSEDPRPLSKEDFFETDAPHFLSVKEPFARPVTPEPPEKVVVKNTVVFSEDALEMSLSPHSDKTDQPHQDLCDLVVDSPTMISRPLGVKYWPPSDDLNLEDDGIAPVVKQKMFRSEEDDNVGEDGQNPEETDKDIEDRKKWLERQFEDPEASSDMDAFQYLYSQPLDQIMEEEDERESLDDITEKELRKLKESLSNAPDFDALNIKRHIALRGDREDVISMSSLQEFERLEREVALHGSGSESRGSIGSQDSLEVLGTSAAVKSNSIGGKRLPSKSGNGDDISVDSRMSLQEFERMEAACREAESNEKKAKEQEECLSEIEEGHESQISESDSCETLSEAGRSDNSEDYEQRMFQIEEIIKQAQSNVERFQDTQKKPEQEMLPLDEILSWSVPKARRTPSVGSAESDSLENDDGQHECSIPRPADSMQRSVDSLDLKVKSSSSKRMETSSDSLDFKTGGIMTLSTDSIEQDQAIVASSGLMTESTDSLDGGCILKPDSTFQNPVLTPQTIATGGATALITSSDSLESCSNNTRATASMLSSLTSNASETVLAELEHDAVGQFQNVKKILLEQGEIHLDDSDESVSLSTNAIFSTTTNTKMSAVDPTDIVALRRTQQGLGAVHQAIFKDM